MAAVEKIYAVAATPALWPEALAAVAGVFDDVGANQRGYDQDVDCRRTEQPPTSNREDPRMQKGRVAMAAALLILSLGPASAQDGQDITARMKGATLYYETQWGGNKVVYRPDGVYSVTQLGGAHKGTSTGRWYFNKAGQICNSMGYIYSEDRKFDSCSRYFTKDGKYQGYIYNRRDQPGNVGPTHPIRTIQLTR